MKRRSVVGIFRTEDGARQAYEELIGAGFPGNSVIISANLGHDDIAAEAPGQSYENQPGQAGTGGWFGSVTGRNARQVRRGAQFEDAVRSGSSVVTVEAVSVEQIERAGHILQTLGAVHVEQAEV
jgi:hypothetical protein